MSTVPKILYDEECAKVERLIEELTEAKTELETIKKDAERYEFILYVHGLVERFEKEYCVNLPEEDNFLIEVRKRSRKIMPHES